MCVLPFKWKNKTWNGCVHETNELPWCATHTDSSGNVLQKNICPSNWGKYLS